MEIKISPSVLACDLSRLSEECSAMEAAGADMIHLDVMDGHFVPNITFGAPVIKSLRDKTGLIFDTHLMVSRPDNFIEDFIKAGSDIITFHIESLCDIDDTIAQIKAQGIKAGISIKPNTPVESILPYISRIDMALVMTVEPGFGGQSFMPDMLKKVSAIRAVSGPDFHIQVDGGINNITAAAAVKAGANVLVAGSYLFNQPDYKQAVLKLRQVCTQAAQM